MHGLCEEIKHGEDFLCHCDKGFTGDNLFIYIKYDLSITFRLAIYIFFAARVCYKLFHL